MLFYTSSVKLADNVKHMNVMHMFNKLFSFVKQGRRALFLYFPKNIGYFTKTNRAQHLLRRSKQSSHSSVLSHTV